MAEVDRKWADWIRAGDARALARQFRHEAGELRRLLSDTQRSTAPAWRDFRHFLADVGPSPGPAYFLQPHDLGGAWQAGNVAWVLRSKDIKPLPPRVPASPGSSYSQWTLIAGMPMQYGDIPVRLGLSFTAMSSSVAAGGTLESLLEEHQQSCAGALDLDWFSDSASHRQAFRAAYLAWREKVQPRYRSAATPQFLYLYMLAPAMALAKASLETQGLWAPLTPAGLERREASAAWKRFNELLPKASATAAGFDAYRPFSLTQDIAALSAQVVAAEARLRHPDA